LERSSKENEDVRAPLRSASVMPGLLPRGADTEEIEEIQDLERKVASIIGRKDETHDPWKIQ